MNIAMKPEVVKEKVGKALDNAQYKLLLLKARGAKQPIKSKWEWTGWLPKKVWWCELHDRRSMDEDHPKPYCKICNDLRWEMAGIEGCITKFGNWLAAADLLEPDQRLDLDDDDVEMLNDWLHMPRVDMEPKTY